MLELDPNVGELEEVAILLESVGISRKSLEELGYRGFRELAQDVLSAVHDLRKSYARYAPKPLEKVGGRKALVIGLALSSPWMFLALNFFGFGYTAFDVSLAVGTSMGLAVMFSLIASGGLQQALLRKYLHYRLQGDPLTAWRIFKMFLAVGSAAAGVSTIAFAILLHLYCLRCDVLLTSTYFYLFYMLWLAIPPLIMAFTSGRAREIARLPASLAPVIILPWPLFSTLRHTLSGEQALTVSHIIPLAASLALTICLTRPSGVRAEVPKSTPLRTFTRPPRLGVTLYHLSPLLLYGTLYPLFLFADRISVWSSRGPYPLTMDPAYEMTMGLAMLGFVPAAIIGAYLALDTARQLALRLGEAMAWEEEVPRKWVWRRARSAHLTLLALSLVVVSPFILAEDLISRVLGASIPGFLLPAAAAGYYLLGIFTLNGQLLLLLNRLWGAVGVLTAGLAVSLLASLYLTQASGNPYSAAIGFATGSLTLAVVSSIYISRILRSAPLQSIIF